MFGCCRSFHNIRQVEGGSLMLAPSGTPWNSHICHLVDVTALCHDQSLHHHYFQLFSVGDLSKTCCCIVSNFNSSSAIDDCQWIIILWVGGFAWCILRSGDSHCAKCTFILAKSITLIIYPAYLGTWVTHAGNVRCSSSESELVCQV